MNFQQECIPLQIKVFSHWFDNKLNQRSDVKVNDITKDLNNGVALVELARILTKKEISNKWHKNPQNEFDKIHNCELALEMFKENGVQLSEISGKDISSNNRKHIIDLIWTLISYYSIGFQNDKELISWVAERTKNYSNIRNFHPYFLSMCALLDSYFPEKINYNSLNPKDTTKNSKLAIDIMKELDIEVYIYPEDFDDPNIDIDQKVLLTQLSSFKKLFESFMKHSKSAEAKELSSTFSKDLLQNHEIEFNQGSHKSNEQIPLSHPIDGDNSQYAGRKFGLVMKLNKSDYNNGKEKDLNDHQNYTGELISLAVTLEKEGKPFLNPAGLKLFLKESNIENDVYQQFTFGKGSWTTVIDSFVRKGMVWDVTDEFNLNPPSGTPFYLFPFHGRHNQHFIYKNEMIYAKQNGMVVTFIGGHRPFQMMPPNPSLKERQTFKIQLL